MASALEQLRWRRIKSPVAEATIGNHIKVFQAEVSDGHLTVMTGREPEFHLSISHRVDVPGKGLTRPGRYPTWDEIRDARYLFCPKDVTMAMVLPPESEYVNVHETTFHLWEIPDD